MELHRALGLSDDEAAQIEEILGRAPERPRARHVRGDVERALLLQVVSAAPQTAPDRGAPRPRRARGRTPGSSTPGTASRVALRIESHNHPSAVEPYQGAATGVGGILRDIFTMGARPIALMDPLFFGTLDDARNRWLTEGVVAGISGYGNSVGVPTVGGELTFAPCYARNPLVNVLCLGVMPVERLVLGRATRRGQPGGAARGHHRARRDRRGERARLGRLRARGRRRRGQAPQRAGGGPLRGEASHRGVSGAPRPGPRGRDPGPRGGGLTCATSETAARGGMGMDVLRRPVARREPGHGALRGDDLGEPGAHARHRHPPPTAPRWRRCAAVGGARHGRSARRPRPTGRRRSPAHPRRRGSGPRRRPRRLALRRRPALRPRRGPRPPTSTSAGATIPAAPWPRRTPATFGAGRPRPCSRDASWVYRQYDHQLFLNTVVGPGEDAAVLRLAAPGFPASRGAWPSPRTPIPGGARWTRAWARP